MSKAVAVVTQLVEPVCAALGYDLVDVQYLKEGASFVLRLVIDKPGGITIDDCELVSRRVDPVLDEADPIAGSYHLQVSSPGLDRPLKCEADFRRFVGSRVKVRAYAPIGGRRNFTGLLAGWRDGWVVLEENGEGICIPFAQIAKATLVPQF